MSERTTTFARVHKNPIIITSHKLKTPNIPTSRLHFSGEFVVSNLFLRQKRSWEFNTMDRAIEISAFKGSSDSDIESEIDKRAVLEQEGLIHNHGSSRFVSSFDPTRFESILNSMSKWLMTAIFLTVGVIRHDAMVLWAATGSVMNVLLSNLLKKIINQERPVSASKADPGMPSSHAQSIFFIFLFAIISMIESFGANGLTIALSGLTLAIGSYLSWLRVSQRLHTISQVLVGAVVGSIFSILWFWLWDTFVQQVFLSNLWVRILVVLGAAGFSVGFTIYAIQNWIMERKQSM